MFVSKHTVCGTKLVQIACTFKLHTPLPSRILYSSSSKIHAHIAGLRFMFMFVSKHTTCVSVETHIRMKLGQIACTFELHTPLPTFMFICSTNHFWRDHFSATYTAITYAMHAGGLPAMFYALQHPGHNQSSWCVR